MNYKLFIDDERFPVEDDWVIARTSGEAIGIMTDRGWPQYISFDHDLGGPDTSRNVVNWMVEQALDGDYPGYVPGWYVHSQNPIGRDWINNRMRDLVQIDQMLKKKR